MSATPDPPSSGPCTAGMHMHGNNCWREGWRAGFEAGCSDSDIRVSLAEAHEQIKALTAQVAALQSKVSWGHRDDGRADASDD